MVRRPGFVIIATCLTIALLTTVAARQGGRVGAGQTISIRAARLLDGRGRTLANGVIEVQGSKIVTVDQRSGPVTYDLGDATLLPGLIDVHVHLNWYFGPDGRYGGRGVLPSFATDAVLDNARATLMAGFTTVQSVGWIGDKPLREAIAAGVVNGPRLLTSLGQLQGGSSTPQELRERVRQAKADGADLIKFFASASIRDGGRMNVTQAQGRCRLRRGPGARTPDPGSRTQRGLRDRIGQGGLHANRAWDVRRRCCHQGDGGRSCVLRPEYRTRAAELPRAP